MRQALTNAAKRPLVALFVLAAIPCIALAQSAQDFAKKVAIGDMYEDPIEPACPHETAGC